MEGRTYDMSSRLGASKLCSGNGAARRASLNAPPRSTPSVAVAEHAAPLYTAGPRHRMRRRAHTSRSGPVNSISSVAVVWVANRGRELQRLHMQPSPPLLLAFF
ncbi:hypothetical protein VPH35_079922 [Triticum aestivum]